MYFCTYRKPGLLLRGRPRCHTALSLLPRPRHRRRPGHYRGSVYRLGFYPGLTTSLSESCKSHSSISDESDVDSLAGIIHIKIFSGPNEDVALFPLCELWGDITSVFRTTNEEDIPSIDAP
ncbi:hypothetical protein C8Q77DRAFT_1140713 [Trametes polyzona]|nr:hypothetical protein C8Q77DRAFT_1140713 [Trametes polyzona]